MNTSINKHVFKIRCVNVVFACICACMDIMTLLCYLANMPFNFTKIVFINVPYLKMPTTIFISNFYHIIIIVIINVL